MLELLYPWMLLLLPLPVLVRLLPPYIGNGVRVRAPFLDRLLALAGDPADPRPAGLAQSGPGLLPVWMVWVVLVCAATRPVWFGPAIEQRQSGRDLMVAVDISGSMATPDMTGPGGERLERLRVAQQVLGDLVSANPTDRLGLIVFGSAAYLQAPLTADHAAWLRLLEEVETGMAGPRTALGDAIGLSVTVFAGSRSSDRILIVLTDGNDTGSMVPPVTAARVAADRKVRIYTIAIGDPAELGEQILDLDTLQRISELTGGRYFRAFNAQEVQRAYAAINALEPAPYTISSYRPVTDLHWIPVGLAMVLYLAMHLWSLAAAARGRTTRGKAG